MPNFVDAYIGQRLSLRCTEANISLGELAEYLGVPKARVLNYINGSIRINVEHLIVISHTLHVNIGYFFDGIDDKLSAARDTPRLSLVTQNA